jgi:hypothetical protein
MEEFDIQLHKPASIRVVVESVYRNPNRHYIETSIAGILLEIEFIKETQDANPYHQAVATD